MIYYKQEKFSLAEMHFQKALDINPQSSVLLCHIGVVSRLHLTLSLCFNLLLCFVSSRKIILNILSKKSQQVQSTCWRILSAIWMNNHRINVSEKKPSSLSKLLLVSNEIILSGHVCESAKIVVIFISRLCTDTDVNRVLIGVFSYLIHKKLSGF